MTRRQGARRGARKARTPAPQVSPAPYEWRADAARMLSFARHWLPAGGATAEDIFVAFGIPGPTFYARLARLLDDSAIRATLPGPTVAALTELCTATTMQHDQLRSAAQRSAPRDRPLADEC